MVVPLHMLSSHSEERERESIPQGFFPQESDLTYSVFYKIHVPLHMLSIPSPQYLTRESIPQEFLFFSSGK